MKKTIFILGLFCAVVSTNAQDLSKTLGLRVGDNDGVGAEVSYQHPLNDVNRVQVDLGIRNSTNVDSYKLSGSYQFVKPLSVDGIPEGFSWFYGAGAGLGYWSTEVSVLGTTVENDETYALVSGTVGLEYNFEFPLQLTLDVRPEYSFGDFNDDLGIDLALGIRYRFN